MTGVFVTPESGRPTLPVALFQPVKSHDCWLLAAPAGDRRPWIGLPMKFVSPSVHEPATGAIVSSESPVVAGAVG